MLPSRQEYISLGSMQHRYRILNAGSYRWWKCSWWNDCGRSDWFPIPVWKNGVFCNGRQWRGSKPSYDEIITHLKEKGYTTRVIEVTSILEAYRIFRTNQLPSTWIEYLADYSIREDRHMFEFRSSFTILNRRCLNQENDWVVQKQWKNATNWQSTRESGRC